MLDFDSFSSRARSIAASFPREFMAGIEAVEVHRDLKRHPFLEEVVTLGECSTSPLSDPSGQEPFRSTVHLYYGSFADLAEQDPTFDVEAELRETIEHEIQHHLEDRAGFRELRDEDDLFEAHARFRAGMEVPPGWYRLGEPVGDHLYAVDLDLFLEIPTRRKDWERLRGTTIRVEVLGEPLELEIPADADPKEVFTVEGAGLFEPDEGHDPDDPDAPGTAGDLHVVPS